jgi:hypothetical protein
MDVQKGETAMSQIHNGLALAAGHALQPGYALVAMSGGAEYKHRRDFEFIRHRIADQGVRWVCYREPDRIARNDPGDRLLISTQSMIGEFGRA